MTDPRLEPFLGEWELTADLPGAHGVGRATFEWLGALLVQRTEIPDPQAPSTVAVIAARDGGGFLQHYFDSRGVVRLYEMTLDGPSWTLLRTRPDFTALEFHQRYLATLAADGSAIDGEWQTSSDGRDWRRDFRLTYRRV